MNNASIKDVAKLANVSTATVSHVLNETRYVSETTKIKVYQAMKELDYQPNLMAKGLRSRKSNIIGLIVPMLYSDTSNFFFMSIANGIETYLKQEGYNLILSNSHEDFETEVEQIKLFNSKLIDGLIVAPTGKDITQYENVFSNEYPVVFIDRIPEGYTGDTVLADSKQGTYQAIKTLLEKGHEKIGFITGYLGLTTSDDRLLGYKEAFLEQGLSVNPNLIKEGEPSLDSGYEIAKQLVKKENVTALFIANNIMTMGALSFLNDHKLRVPDDVALIGFDDYDWMKVTTPPISVIKQPSFEIGEKAVNLLLKRIAEDKGARNERIVLSTEFVIRGSI
ncbi:LacI family transcriptional regulator [Anaerobacillus alkaliphilus]|uniref:LacI family transcriptional regulator n=1 Tax=Anaerobacillus alkaliphilus TaxID=1548597 RepID=A0A4Q0VUG7_9BACI|nr:LacI family DNA-binding transcriptional regulator [Anaerobacillus alkaliphilus]RXJ02198.1 LacI family transcriptional regulator [Anaerobacillus alkaliphilus]